MAVQERDDHLAPLADHGAAGPEGSGLAHGLPRVAHGVVLVRASDAVRLARGRSRCLTVRASVLCLNPAPTASASATERCWPPVQPIAMERDRKSTRLNSSHVRISYAVFCLKKKKE